MQTFSVQQLIATPTLLTQLRLTPGYRKPWERRSWGVNKVTINWYKVTWLLTTRVLIYQQGGEHLSLVNAILHCTFLVIVVSVSGSSTKPFHTKLHDANASVQIWVIIFGRTDKQSYGKLLTQLFSAKATMSMWVSKYKLAAYCDENKCHIIRPYQYSSTSAAYFDLGQLQLRYNLFSFTSKCLHWCSLSLVCGKNRGNFGMSLDSRTYRIIYWNSHKFSSRNAFACHTYTNWQWFIAVMVSTFSGSMVAKARAEETPYKRKLGSTLSCFQTPFWCVENPCSWCFLLSLTLAWQQPVGNHETTATGVARQNNWKLEGLQWPGYMETKQYLAAAQHQRLTLVNIWMDLALNGD